MSFFVFVHWYEAVPDHQCSLATTGCAEPAGGRSVCTSGGHPSITQSPQYRIVELSSIIQAAYSYSIAPEVVEHFFLNP